jgi:hypothetical protein
MGGLCLPTNRKAYGTRGRKASATPLPIPTSQMQMPLPPPINGNGTELACPSRGRTGARVHFPKRPKNKLKKPSRSLMGPGAFRSTHSASHSLSERPVKVISGATFISASHLRQVVFRPASSIPISPRLSPHLSSSHLTSPSSRPPASAPRSGRGISTSTTTTTSAAAPDRSGYCPHLAGSCSCHAAALRPLPTAPARRDAPPAPRRPPARRRLLLPLHPHIKPPFPLPRCFFRPS